MSSNEKRIDWLKLSRRAGYIVSFTLVAGVAAYVSFGHIYEVALLAHQPRHLALVLPLSVDGLMLIGTLAMAEDKAANRLSRGWARVALWTGAAVSVAANIGSTLVHYGLDPFPLVVAGWAPIALFVAIEVVSRPGKPKIEPASTTRVSVPDTVAELESPGQLPEAPVSPAPKLASHKRRSVAERRAAGEVLPERTERRDRTGR